MTDIPSKREMIKQLETRSNDQKISYLIFLKDNLKDKDPSTYPLYQVKMDWIETKINIYCNMKTIIKTDYGLTKFME